MGDIGVIFAFILSERDALLRFKRISRKAMKDLIWKHQDYYILWLETEANSDKIIYVRRI
jgi:hypothetical protein